jgi:predicted acetyltransferase
MPTLISPTARLHAAWIASRDDFGRGVNQDGSGLRPTDEVDSAPGFAAWVERLNREDDLAIPAAEGWVHCTYRWIVEDDEMLGSISLRHELNDFLLEAGGHIGYSVRPSARRRGLASWALHMTLDAARARGLDRVLVTCKVPNEASARTIESQGGVLEDIRDTTLGPMKRYWITL